MNNEHTPVHPDDNEYLARFEGDQVQVKIKGQWVHLGRLAEPNIGKSEGPHLRFESKTDDGPDYDTRREAMHHAVTLIKGDVTYPDPGEAAVTFAKHIAKYLHNGELPNND